MIDKITFALACALMVSFITIFATLVHTDKPAQCTTDSDCLLLLCERADLDCDGGPASVR